MTFRHLEIFMSVYQNQSITKASKELHISQPSVSLAIKELEEKYQTPLFDRMNRQIYPTKKAHLLYNHSLQILSSLENMENEMYEDRVENISFGCSVTMAQVFLPPLLKKLKMIYPTIHFHIIVNNLEYIENLLLKNELDFALIETTPLHQLKKMAFYQDELVIIVHPKHPLLKVKDLKELEHFDYYSREKGSSIYELVHSYFISHDLDIVPTIECTNPHALIELVKQNDGFTILPYSLVKESKEITYLKNNDFVAMEPGVYEIEGKKMYAQVFDAETEPAEKKRPEVHEKFLDVQFLASGREKLGFTPDTGNYEVDERFDERDLIFYKSVENEGYITATPGCFCVFFPSDVHRPAVADGEPMTVRKVVVKVSIDLL